MLKDLSPRSSSRGFTIIELMIVVTVLAVLMAVAAPAMRSFVINQRVKTASFDLYSTLAYARSEAIKRPGGQVRITPTTASNWEDGWTVSFFPAGGGTAVELRRQAASQNITIAATPDNANLAFQHDGRPVAPMVFTLDASGVTGVPGRCAIVGASGGLATKVKPSGGGC